MIQSKLIKLNKFLDCGIFQASLFDSDSVVKSINFALSKGKKLKILYGETYDEYGMTIDSLKYYLIVSIFTLLLEEIGCEVEAIVIVGDRASAQNDNVEDKAKMFSLGKQRYKEIIKRKQQLSLNFKPQLMSPVLKNKKIQRRIEQLQELYRKDSNFRDILEGSVMHNRLKEESEKGFQYAIEEIALIVDYDFKIGPPRENRYDEAAKYAVKKLGLTAPIAIYVKPTYPLGLNFDFYINYPEIEKYGLTPYKAGSNKLQEYRIILNKTRERDIRKLIKSSFKSVDKLLPNPVLDLYIICDLVDKMKSNNVNFESQYEYKREIDQIVVEETTKLIRSIQL